MLQRYEIYREVVCNNDHKDPAAPPPFFPLLLWRICHGWSSPSCLVLRASDNICLPPHFWKNNSLPSVLWYQSAVASILSLSLFHLVVLFFTIIYSWGRAVPLNLYAKSKAWVKEGNFCTSCKLSKGKSHPVFILGVGLTRFLLSGAFGG